MLKLTYLPVFITAVSFSFRKTSSVITVLRPTFL